MIRTKIQLSEKQVQALKSLAAREKVSMAELIRRAVDSLLHERASDTPADRRERAVFVAGRFSSGHKDISNKHDEYLADAFGP